MTSQFPLLPWAIGLVAQTIWPGRDDAAGRLGGILYSTVSGRYLHRIYWQPPHDATKTDWVRDWLLESRSDVVVDDRSLLLGEISLAALDGRVRLVRSLDASLGSRNTTLAHLIMRRQLAIYVPTGEDGKVTQRNSDTSFIFCVYSSDAAPPGPWESLPGTSDYAIEDLIRKAWDDGIPAQNGREDLQHLAEADESRHQSGEEAGGRIVPYDGTLREGSQIAQIFTGNLAAAVRPLGVAAATLREVKSDTRHELWKVVGGWLDVHELAEHLWRERRDASLLRARASQEHDEYARLLSSAVEHAPRLLNPSAGRTRAQSSPPASLPYSPILTEYLLPVCWADRGAGTDGFVIAFGVRVPPNEPAPAIQPDLAQAAAEASAALSGFLTRALRSKEGDSPRNNPRWPLHLEDFARSVLGALLRPAGAGGAADRRAQTSRLLDQITGRKPTDQPGAADLVRLFEELLNALGDLVYITAWSIGRTYALHRGPDRGHARYASEPGLGKMELVGSARVVARLRNVLRAFEPEDGGTPRAVGVKLEWDPATRRLVAPDLPKREATYLHLPEKFEREGKLELALTYEALSAQIRVAPAKEHPWWIELHFDRARHGASPLLMTIIQPTAVADIFKRRASGGQRTDDGLTYPSVHVRPGLFDKLHLLGIESVAFNHGQVFHNGGLLTTGWAEQWNKCPLPALADWAEGRLQSDSVWRDGAADVYDWVRDNVLPDLHGSTRAPVPKEHAGPLLTIASRHFAPDRFREFPGVVSPALLVPGSLRVGGLKGYTDQALMVFFQVGHSGERQRFVATFFGGRLPFGSAGSLDGTGGWESTRGLLYAANRHQLVQRTYDALKDHPSITLDDPSRVERIRVRLRRAHDLTWRRGIATEVRRILDVLLGSTANGTDDALSSTPTPDEVSDKDFSDARDLFKRFDIVTRYVPMLEALRDAERFSRADAALLLLGPTGVGKSTLASRIHEVWRASKGAGKRAFVARNVAAIPEALFEAEMFGSQRGSFTGAIKDTIGVFKAADEGTLFLDEVGDLPIRVQAALLTVLDNKKFVRIGDTAETKVSVRLIAATNRDLAALVVKKEFRQDLYERLKTLTITIPPLNGRLKDIEWLLVKTLGELDPNAAFGKGVVATLARWPWPGNIRELQSSVRSAYYKREPDEPLTLDLFDAYRRGTRLEFPAPPGPGDDETEHLRALARCLRHLPQNRETAADPGIRWRDILSGGYERNMRLWIDWFLHDQRFYSNRDLCMAIEGLLIARRGGASRVTRE